jgi:hypothetical protein
MRFAQYESHQWPISSHGMQFIQLGLYQILNANFNARSLFRSPIGFGNHPWKFIATVFDARAGPGSAPRAPPPVALTQGPHEVGKADAGDAPWVVQHGGKAHGMNAPPAFAARLGAVDFIHRLDGGPIGSALYCLVPFRIAWATGMVR